MHWTRDCASVSIEHHWPAPVMRSVRPLWTHIAKATVCRPSLSTTGFGYRHLCSCRVAASQLFYEAHGHSVGLVVRSRHVCCHSWRGSDFLLQAATLPAAAVLHVRQRSIAREQTFLLPLGLSLRHLCFRVAP